MLLNKLFFEKVRVLLKIKTSKLIPNFFLEFGCHFWYGQSDLKFNNQKGVFIFLKRVYLSEKKGWPENFFFASGNNLKESHIQFVRLYLEKNSCN